MTYQGQELRGVTEVCTAKELRGMTAAAKRVLKSGARHDAERLGHAWVDGNGRQCMCDGYRLYRLAGRLDVETGEAALTDEGTHKLFPDGRELVELWIDWAAVDRRAAQVAEERRALRADKTICRDVREARLAATARYELTGEGSAHVDEELPMVNLDYLLDMRTMFPAGQWYMLRDELKRQNAPLVVMAEYGDGILLPIRNAAAVARVERKRRIAAAVEAVLYTERRYGVTYAESDDCGAALWIRQGAGLYDGEWAEVIATVRTERSEWGEHYDAWSYERRSALRQRVRDMMERHDEIAAKAGKPSAAELIDAMTAEAAAEVAEVAEGDGAATVAAAEPVEGAQAAQAVTEVAEPVEASAQAVTAEDTVDPAAKPVADAEPGEGVTEGAPVEIAQVTPGERVQGDAERVEVAEPGAAEVAEAVDIAEPAERAEAARAATVEAAAPGAAEPGEALRLDTESVRRANDVSQFHAGDAIAREAAREYAEGLDKIAAMVDGDGELTERQRAMLEERRAGWRKLCEQSYNDIIRRRASWAPWTVTGPANYPAERMSKRAEAQFGAAWEWAHKRERYLANTAQMLREATPVEAMVERYRRGECSEPIASDDPAAVELLTARLEYLREAHRDGVARNAWYRKHGTMRGYDGWSDDRAARADEAIRSAALYKVPYPPYAVQNSNANIKRLEQRLAEIQRRRESVSTEPVQLVHNGFRVGLNVGQIAVTFDAKPEADARQVLKSHGFHWSPRAAQWQRKRTDNAERDLRLYVIPELERLEAYAPQPVEQVAEAMPEEPERAVELEPVDGPEPVDAGAAVEQVAEAVDAGQTVAEVQPVDAAQAVEPEPVQTVEPERAPVVKDWIGETLSGAGWSIVASAEAGRIVVRLGGELPRRTRKAMVEVIRAAGWCWNPSLDAWTRGLRCKAWRAAGKLAAALAEIVGERATA